MELPKVVAAVAAAEGLTTLVKADDKATQVNIDFHAAALVAALGMYMLVAEEDDDQRLLGMTGSGPMAAIALGASISLDELAIGFSAGLLRLPVVPMVIAIAVQAFVVTQVGLRLGGRIGRRLRERTESIAGLALLALGATLLIQG